MEDTTVIRERMLENNKTYLINIGRQINEILNEGIVHEESLSTKDNNALMLYRTTQNPP